MTLSPYPQYDAIEAAMKKQGEELWQELQASTPGIFNMKYWQGLLMDWVMRDPEVKVDLFRFVDVLPSLTSDTKIVEHFKSYILTEHRDIPTLLDLSFKLFSNRLTAGVAAATLKSNITNMAENFIAGSSVENALPVLRNLYDDGCAFTADILGEKTTSLKEADIYLAHYHNLVEKLGDETPNWPYNEILCCDHMGYIPSANISIKISALDSQIDPVDLAGSVARLKERLLPLLIKAKERNVFVNFDLEQWDYHFITYHLFEEVASVPELRGWPHLGIVIQAYLKYAHKDLDFLTSLSQSRGTPFTVRLVKGAYWDYEVIHATQLGIAPPVFQDKSATDACYETVSYNLLSRHEKMRPAFASHNVRSLLCAVHQANELKVPPQALEMQMLIGMAEPIREMLKKQSHRVRLYAPIGKLLPGMAYLVRRLLENTSNSGFLRQGFYEQKEVAHLLVSPHKLSTTKHDTLPKIIDEQTRFHNAPLLDFALPETVSQFQHALDKVKSSLPIEVNVEIDGETVKKLDLNESYSPNDLSMLVSNTYQAGDQEAESAVKGAYAAWPAWRNTSLQERVERLHFLGELLEESRFEFAALQCVEVGKPWREADGDVAEAIDFCHYYAMQAEVELCCRPQGDMVGEENTLYYDGRGPTAVIAPWNFPLAILCGMTTAALVAGNSVIIKPSRNSCAIAYKFFLKVKEAGFPEGVVQFLPGPGGVVGNYLVEHPDIAQIAFTGSKEVGLGIISRAGVTRTGQKQMKRIVCEMGGKNANIIDDDADLDVAVLAVVKGAFGYAGQKCSACSRVIVHKSIYDNFTARLVEAIGSLTITTADLAECRLGPVIDKESQNRLNTVLDHAGDDVKILYHGALPDLNGNFVAPLLVEVKSTQHPLFQKELFGPVLTIMQAEDFDEALKLANESQYALTGALFSRHKEHIKRARSEFRVGNLYINRESTGAIVDRQPFGGFAMSGFGHKAGGPEYLRLFCDTRCVCENTMRQGFSPELQL